MGTFLKYFIYLLVVIALYIIGKGIYDGSITSSTTVGSVAEQVDTGTRNMAGDAAKAVGNMVNEATQARQCQ